jgi:hypothetical protein
LFELGGFNIDQDRSKPGRHQPFIAPFRLLPVIVSSWAESHASKDRHNSSNKRSP